MKTLKLVLFLLLLCCGTLTAQESSQSNKENLLAFIPGEVKQFQLFRPAQILRDRDMVEFKRIAGKSFSRFSDRIFNRYFKFGLADLEDIDSLIDVVWHHRDEGGRSWDHHSMLILRTERPNEDKFNMATHAVKEEIEYNGQTILKMKVPLDGRYQFACILDEKTIIWARLDTSLKRAIDAGKRGPLKSEFYSTWKKLASKDCSFFVQFDERDLRNAPGPWKKLKGLQWMVAGIELSKSPSIDLHAKFDNNNSAEKAADQSGELIGFLRKIFESQANSQPEQKVATDVGIELLENTEVKHSKDRVLAKSQIKLNLQELTQPMQEMVAASKRTEAANHIRQNYLALLNFESVKGEFPPSVLVHESGKKYSWRIAILPYIGRQDLYDSYDFTQEWNSPHNLEVTSDMPDFFRSDNDDRDSTNTSFFMLTGPGGAFGESEAMRIARFTDGTSNTMALIEARRDVHWAKPEDIVIDPEQPLPDFGGFHQGGFHVSMADGSVRFVDENFAEEILREYLTPDGGEIPRPLVPPQEDGD